MARTIEKKRRGLEEEISERINQIHRRKNNQRKKKYIINKGKARAKDDKPRGEKTQA